ncbi:ABC-type protease/lipase transport system fused ATPase/permease subunit [Agrobacterium tumefaciens]|uniref:ABC-type protease/lipase transport system fused ATPase/permease subunit n=1 Tax=Agrobacterium radiobacter TaxID=362 RepID=A0ABR6JCE6_AGRRD|nr:hypothetical protein [Agrobacterium radiobacter]MBB4337147.1 ABC-type protease/lipase transport system fused ATPase/permease subunit [Agrobacterium radiobacter]MBB4492605.1 ABC-type protease/lipase transport system fused ATPase/permease subunit [Agrobacterium radiobacter]MBB4497503.1 ABC-type protease/lipase transport system fused ATPase/permease subunit [Agrobacterium radiobacter]MBB4502586.1 ABC-type protease/lipase transport system fused ATPase/permease subunit [Agrobacterium radiobacter]
MAYALTDHLSDHPLILQALDEVTVTPLTLILIAGLYAFSGFLEILRARVLSRAAGLVDAALSK